MTEIDLLRNAADDLADIDRQNYWIGKLGAFDFVLTTPPCASHSRAPWANEHGPHPIRSSAFPRGFPWLSRADTIKAEFYNSLTDFSWKVL